MSQLTTTDKAGGNTKTPASQHRRWCFTLNNYGENDVDKLTREFTRVSAVKWVFSKEVGDSGTPHLQGYVEFRNAKTLQGVKNIISQRAHVERARGTAEQNYGYCTKSKDDKWEHGWVVAALVGKLRSAISQHGARPFQQHVLNIVASPVDERIVHWFWDSYGNTGKTALAKHLVLEGEAIYVNGKAADVKYAVAEWIKVKKPLKTVIFGIPRTVTSEYVSYSALEEVKDGIFFSGKYEGGMCVYEVPHVIVFANFPPDPTKLSSDRWNIVDISQADFSNVSLPLANSPVTGTGPAAAGGGDIGGSQFDREWAQHDHTDVEGLPWSGNGALTPDIVTETVLPLEVEDLDLERIKRYMENIIDMEEEEAEASRAATPVSREPLPGEGLGDYIRRMDGM